MRKGGGGVEKAAFPKQHQHPTHRPPPLLPISIWILFPAPTPRSPTPPPQTHTAPLACAAAGGTACELTNTVVCWTMRGTAKMMLWIYGHCRRQHAGRPERAKQSKATTGDNMQDGLDAQGKKATHKPHMPQPRSISSPPSGIPGTMGFWSCPSPSAKGSTAGTPLGTSAAASTVGPPSLTSSAYCKRTGHFGHSTKNIEDERCSTATKARALPMSGTNTAECNTAECKPSHGAKGHRVVRHPSAAAAVASLVVTSGTASRCRPHLIDTGHHTDRRACCCNGCRNGSHSCSIQKRVVGDAESPMAPSQAAERTSKTC